MKKILSTILLTLVGAVTMMAQMQMPSIPVDPDVRIGKLDNGLTYYIRHNNWPENRAEFYIAQKVGSIQENDDQRGLAHFLEHMAFNGSKHFKGNELLRWCESIGVKFGTDLNAYTSIDQTVYNISNVPTTRESIVDSCLLILYDWADGLLLEQEEIEKERGVIHEEWRLRTSAQQRMLERDLPKLYPGSKYGHRMPIGLMEIIDNFERPFLQAYYEKWYRPDNQAIIVVGDVDVNKVEEKIKGMFADIKLPENPEKVVKYPVPDNAEPIIVIDKDKEQRYNIMEVLMKHEAFPDTLKGTMAYLITDYIKDAALSMLRDRLKEYAEKPESPFLQAFASDGQYLLSNTVDAFELGFLPKDGQTEAALTAVLTEARRAAEFGFTPTEYNRFKADFTSNLDKQYSNKDKRFNSQFVNQYVQHFIDNEPIPSIDYTYETMKQIVPLIPIEAVNALIKELVAKDAKNLVILNFNKEGDNKILSENSVVGVINGFFPNAKYDVVEKENYQPAQAIIPPNLDIVENSIAFLDKSGKKSINANGSYAIQFQIKNSGKGEGKGCKVKITAKGNTKGINYKEMSLKSIPAGETQTIKIPITSDINTEDGQVEFSIQVTEPNGFGTDPHYLSVATHVFEEPSLKIVDYSITANNGSVLKKKQPFDLQLLLQNIKHGQADVVTVSLDIPQNVMLLEGNSKEHFPIISGGETKSLVYSLIVNNNYVGNKIPITIHVKEKYGKYAEDKTINLSIDQSLASTKIAVNENQQVQENVQIAHFDDEVDKNLPIADKQQKNTFAVIIGNENYSLVAPVPFALNDAKMFSEYCRQTLGLPSTNIRCYENATLGMFYSAINDIKRIANAYKGNIKILFYYAGHGIPDENTHDAFILPVDADGREVETCYKLSRLYQELGSLNAKNVFVFMDACFSGAKRGEGMLASARGVAIKAKNTIPEGNIVVLSAASNEETAYPYKEKKHGLFTYFLLKKLQETKGECTIGELGEFVKREVLQHSVLVNRKSQTPTLIPSQAISVGWEGLKLK